MYRVPQYSYVSIPVYEHSTRVLSIGQYVLYKYSMTVYLYLYDVQYSYLYRTRVPVYTVDTVVDTYEYEYTRVATCTGSTSGGDQYVRTGEYEYLKDHGRISSTSAS